MIQSVKQQAKAKKDTVWQGGMKCRGERGAAGSMGQRGVWGRGFTWEERPCQTFLRPSTAEAVVRRRLTSPWLDRRR